MSAVPKRAAICSRVSTAVKFGGWAALGEMAAYSSSGSLVEDGKKLVPDFRSRVTCP